jgi:hypothetical protein
LISFNSAGDFSKTINFLKKSANGINIKNLERFGKEGVDALSKNTPVDSGLTASSWNYKISNSKGETTISWYNSNVVEGVPIAIILQYGHGTQNGGWIEGRDYINPTMKPIFDKLLDQAWKEVTNK